MKEKTVILTTSKAALTETIQTAVRTGFDTALEAARQTKQMEKSWLSNREAMEYLQVSKATMQRLRSSGTLRYSLLRGSVYYRLADIEELLEERLVGQSLTTRIKRRQGA